MFCPNCGCKLPQDARFCPQCGRPARAPSVISDAGAQQAEDTAAQQAGAQAAPADAPPPCTPAEPPSPGPDAGLGRAQEQRRAAASDRGCLIAALVALALLLMTVFALQRIFRVLFPETPSTGASSAAAPSVTAAPAARETSGPAPCAPQGSRAYYVDAAAAQRATVMIYMVGSDLESEGGCATLDIGEMCNAMPLPAQSSVTVVLQAGGAKTWNNAQIQDGQTARWLVRAGGLTLLEDLDGAPMLRQDTLSDFVRDCADQFPADRYMLIFWDHGAGSLYGFGYDELNEQDVLLLSDMDAALARAGVKFDFVGFDACLMGTVETAYMLREHADYLIASQETEPGSGWQYTGWLQALLADPAVSTQQLGRRIISDYAASAGDAQTLAMVDLTQIQSVYDQLDLFLEGLDDQLTGDHFAFLSAARAHAKAFAGGDYDMVDIVDFARRADAKSADALAQAVARAVVARNDCTQGGVNGLSMYFPYRYLEDYSYAKRCFAPFDFGGGGYGFFDQFVSLLAGGRTGFDAAAYDWYDGALFGDAGMETLNYEALEVVWSEENSCYMLPMDEHDWSLLLGVETQLLYDDGQGYIDLGSDQYFETDSQDNLLMICDNTWVAIGGQIVPYYAEQVVELSDGLEFSGYVPALLNGETEIELVLKWTDQSPDGWIAGYRLLAANNTLSKLRDLAPGDTLEFYCDYYTYDLTYDGYYFLGDALTVGPQPPAVTYEDLGDAPVVMCYQLVDIYQNYTWTEMVELTY